jgi:hypothetical protein
VQCRCVYGINCSNPYRLIGVVDRVICGYFTPIVFVFCIVYLLYYIVNLRTCFRARMCFKQLVVNFRRLTFTNIVHGAHTVYACIFVHTDLRVLYFRLVVKLHVSSECIVLYKFICLYWLCALCSNCCKTTVQLIVYFIRTWYWSISVYSIIWSLTCISVCDEQSKGRCVTVHSEVFYAKHAGLAVNVFISH